MSLRPALGGIAMLLLLSQQASGFSVTSSRLTLTTKSTAPSLSLSSPSIRPQLNTPRMALVPSIPVILAKIATLAPGMKATSFVAAAGLPSLLGFWKSEYGVSYAYGFAMLLSGILALPHCTSPLAQLHALIYVLYGARLNLFLLYREINIPTFREFKQTIEERAKAKGNRLTRAPFIIICSLLYLGMAAPLQITAKAAPSPLAAPMLTLMYSGWALAALGDAQKTLAKVGQPSKLVTGGLYSVLRHPNFTGEILLWTSSFVLALATAASSGLLTVGSAPAQLGWLVLSAIGMAGINFVLMQAATGLEKRQKTKYGESAEYRDWVSKTWSGPVFAAK